MNTLTVQSDKLLTRGGLSAARRLARSSGLPIQYMRCDGSVVIVWQSPTGSMRQKTYPRDRVRVVHNGAPFFLDAL